MQQPRNRPRSALRRRVIAAGRVDDWKRWDDWMAGRCGPMADVRAMIFWLIVTAFIGTILAQLILDPAAHYIAAVANFWITFSRR